MSGGISVPFTIGGVFAPDYLQPLSIALAVVCIFIASYFIWAKERQRIYELEEGLNPNIQGSINHVTVFTNKNIGIGVAFLVALKNTGADSVADHFSVTHTDSNGNHTQAELVRPRQDVQMTDGGVIKISDDIYSKTTENPILRGGQKTGIIICRFKDKSIDELVSQGGKYSISFLDVLGGKKTFETANMSGPKTMERSVRFPGFDSIVGTGKPLPKSKKKRRRN